MPQRQYGANKLDVLFCGSRKDDDNVQIYKGELLFDWWQDGNHGPLEGSGCIAKSEWRAGESVHSVVWG